MSKTKCPVCQGIGEIEIHSVKDERAHRTQAMMELHNAGHTYRDIASTMKMSLSRVYEVIKLNKKKQAEVETQPA